MDLFKEVTQRSDETLMYPSKSKSTSHIATDESKSDTDSGRSSAPGDQYSSNDTELIHQDQNPQKAVPIYATSLKVIRRNAAAAAQASNGTTHQGSVVIGGSKPLLEQGGHVRRRKEEILRKKQSMARRNTIAIDLVDVDQASDGYAVIGQARSSNHLDQAGLPPNVGSTNNGTSMPDLSATKFATLPNLRVRRRQRVMISTEDLDSSLDTIDFVSANCKGPEFIVNSSLPAKPIDIAEIKCPSEQRRTVSVLLLNGQSLKIACNSASTTAHQVFQAVIQSEGYEENFFLGLCALIGGDFVFLPDDLKIYKVAPHIWFNTYKKPNFAENVLFTLFLRIKFFLPTLRGISSSISRHLLYLQLRKSILESQILCSDDDLIQLGGLALQTEMGNFQQSMKSSEYFTISHYLPEGVYQRNKEMAKHLRNSHFTKHGQPAKETEQVFVKHVQEMKEYGLHLYSAIWSSDDDQSFDVYVSISLCGIALFERSSRVCNDRLHDAKAKHSYQRKLYAQFDWLEIENLCFSKHILCVVVRKPESLKAKDNNRVKYKLKMDGRKSYFAFSLASEHHKFYMKLRNSFTSLKILSQDMNLPLTANQVSTAELIEGAPSSCESVPMKSLAISTNLSSDLDHRTPSIDVNIVPKKPTLTKSTSTRVKNLKKSMLNDNRLLKLRDKFLKRSKSSVGLPSKSKLPDSNSLEENQNKENECPSDKRDVGPPIEVVESTALTSPTQSIGSADRSRMMSPNRNRVKMGTRAIASTKFPNKSYDNIYDTVQNVLANGFERTDGGIAEERDGVNAYSDIETSDDGLSLKSTSLSSLYSSEKMSEKIYTDCGPVNGDEAYVIHSSIRSTSCGPNYFPLASADETVSQSLVEKFNEISVSSNQTQQGADRIIVRIVINKDLVLGGGDVVDVSHKQRPLKVSRRSRAESSGGRTLFVSRSQESIFGGHEQRLVVKADREDAWTLGISIVQGTDNNVYVKDLVAGGPGALAGIYVGDQIIAVDGISLLSRPYSESLRLLQESGRTVELVLSQIYRPNKIRSPSCKAVLRTQDIHQPDVDYLKRIRYQTDEMSLAAQRNEHKHFAGRLTNHSQSGSENFPLKDLQRSSSSANYSLATAKSMPDLQQFLANFSSTPRVPSAMLAPPPPKLTAAAIALPRSVGLSRRYVGPVKYPVTPMRVGLGPEKQRLSLLADEDDEQVFI